MNRSGCHMMRSKANLTVIDVRRVHGSEIVA
jgi:hypothetical protein